MDSFLFNRPPPSNMDIPLLPHNLIQRTQTVATPSYQDVWIKLSQMSARYNDLLRQTRDLISNHQALSTDHLRLQKELLEARTKNEELSSDVSNYRIEAWRLNVKLEDLSNEIKQLKERESRLLSSTKRSFDQIDNDGESAWSASCSSPLSSTPSNSLSLSATSTTATPTNSAIYFDPYALPTTSSNTNFLPSVASYQPTATEEPDYGTGADIRNPKRRKTNPDLDYETVAADEQPSSFQYEDINPSANTLTQAVSLNIAASRSRTRPSSTSTQQRRTSARTRTSTTAVDGPSVRTRSRAKLVPKQESTIMTNPPGDAVAVTASSIGFHSMPAPLKTEDYY